MLSNEKLWWALPGSSQFVGAIEASLLAGKNVIVSLPAHGPSGLRESVHQKLQCGELFSFQRIDLRPGSPAAGTPARVVAQAMHAGGNGIEVSPESLARIDGVGETVVWVGGIDTAAWPAWCDFIVRYELACRNVPQYDRALFVLPLVGLPLKVLPSEKVTLVTHQWRAAIERLDMLLFVSQLLERRARHPLLHQTAVATVAEVAGTDAFVAEFLAGGALEDQLAPLPMLVRLAETRGWGNRSAAGAMRDYSIEWSLGILDDLDGGTWLHSCAAAIANDIATVQRRVWTAQVGVLFPFLERQRLAFIAAHRKLLSLPVVTQWERIEDADSLELSHLAFQLRRRVSPTCLARIELCRRMRNELAHFRPLSVGDLLSAQFLEMLAQPAR